MADNETLVSWRFDVDKCFSIICANGYVMICTIWTMTGGLGAILTDQAPVLAILGLQNDTSKIIVIHYKK